MNKIEQKRAITSKFHWDFRKHHIYNSKGQVQIHKIAIVSVKNNNEIYRE